MEHKIEKQQNMNHEVNGEDLKSKVLELIEKDKIKPTSRMYFSLKDKAFWSFFVLSIVIGSIAFSVMIFSFTNSESQLYEMTHDSVLDFMLDMTPYLWVFIFATFAFVGYENFRYTNKGYKYSFGIILVSSLILNVVGGVTIHAIGLARVIDQDLSSEHVFLVSSDFSKRKVWTQPSRGILSGEIVSIDFNSSTFVLRDFNNNLWTIYSDYVPSMNLDLVSTSSQIRIIGIDQTSSSTPNRLMIACYILPWGSDEYISDITNMKKVGLNDNDYERNISDERNNNCKVIKPYNIINELIK